MRGEESEYVVAIALQATARMESGGRRSKPVTGRARRCSLTRAYHDLRPRARLTVPGELRERDVEWLRQGFAAVVSLGSGKTIASSEDRLGDFLAGVDPSIQFG